jgi:mannose-6-phosphate isomerase-like protein (cupin superfamily)
MLNGLIMVLAAATGSPAPAAPARASVSAPAVELVTSGKLNSLVQATRDGLAVHPVFHDPASSALIVRRDASGEVERHASMSDIMVAKAGTVSILMGGSIEGGREASPGEWRGGRIVGGTSLTFNAGDMLWIPAGIPHQMIIPRGGSFTYVAIKVPSR